MLCRGRSARSHLPRPIQQSPVMVERWGGQPVKRREPLRRAGGLHRSPMKRKPLRRGAMDPDFRVAVLSRDLYACQARVIGYAPQVTCTPHLHVHHRELGTKIDTFENCVTVCDAHHRHLHDVDRAGAEMAGLIVRRGR